MCTSSYFQSQWANKGKIYKSLTDFFKQSQSINSWKPSRIYTNRTRNGIQCTEGSQREEYLAVFWSQKIWPSYKRGTTACYILAEWKVCPVRCNVHLVEISHSNIVK
jgi:hypothetical protein